MSYGLSNKVCNIVFKKGKTMIVNKMTALKTVDFKKSLMDQTHQALNSLILSAETNRKTKQQINYLENYFNKAKNLHVA